MTVSDQPLVPIPTNADELARCLADPQWRLFSGCLYKITVKSQTAVDGVEPDSFVLPFRPNRAQRRFIERLWYRNIILKARQLGFTTEIAILWLDHALFNANQRCGIIAQDRDTAEAIFRDKVKFAYDNLPPLIKERFPLITNSKRELLFAHNNSSLRVATSMRGGTIHRLHISEFGKICAKYPEKAEEVKTGSIPAVPLDGVLVIESTAEGREGEFYQMTTDAQKMQASKIPLTPRDYRLHFFAWWDEPAYRLDSRTVVLTRADYEYFDTVTLRVREELGIELHLDPDQMAWYVATKRADFSGREERMWQEYPSYPAEAFQVSTVGNWYATDMMLLRKRGGITRVPVLDLPVNTFWDIGANDGCAIWFHQELRGEDRFIDYYEAHGEDLRHYVKALRERGYLFGTHYLPHDADYQRLSDFNKTTRDMLQGLMPGERFVIVPRITELVTGIQQVRAHMKGCFIDETRCALGIARLEGYRKRFSKADNRFTDTPDKSNGCSEGADAFRQWAQAKELNLISRGGRGGYEEAPAGDWRVV